MKKNSETIKDVFGRFDLDNNSAIDKKELKIGCRSLGIGISDAEVELIWPIFDEDGSGEIDVDEFISFISIDVSDRLYRKGGARDCKEDQMTNLSRMQRKQRISTKTKLQTTLKELAANFRSVVEKAAKERGCTVMDIFTELDDDGNSNGQLDRHEFMMGASKMKLEFDAERMKILWPMLTGGDGVSDPLTPDRWLMFLSTDKQISFKDLADKFASRFQSREQAAAAAVDALPKFAASPAKGNKYSRREKVDWNDKRRCDLATRARVRRQQQDQETLHRLQSMQVPTQSDGGMWAEGGLPAIWGGGEGAARRASCQLIPAGEDLSGSVSMPSLTMRQPVDRSHTACYPNSTNSNRSRSTTAPLSPSASWRQAMRERNKRTDHRGSISLRTMTKYGKLHVRRLAKPKQDRRTDVKLEMIKRKLRDLGKSSQFDDFSRQRDMLKYI
jgi:Ca2+-binding EF-hand superfamily protein